MRVLICVLSADENGRVISHVHRARHPQQIHGKNYVQGTRLDRFVEYILSARKCGLAVRQAMKQAMQKCDEMYSRLPTVLTDDRFVSDVGVCAVCLNMGTLTTANLGACRAVLLQLNDRRGDFTDAVRSAGRSRIVAKYTKHALRCFCDKK
jgi:hypothetical protein